MSKILELLVNDVSSFDEIAAEFASGQMKSLAQNSINIWRENVVGLNEKSLKPEKLVIILLSFLKRSFLINSFSH